MAGWICLHRDIQEHWLWDFKHADKTLAWIDMLMLANHEKKKFLINGVLIECERGELAYSQITLGERWHWSRNKVRGFMEMLKNDEMIVQRSSTVTTIITICNYSQYQDLQTTEGTTEGTTTVQRKDSARYTNNNVNNYNKKEVVVDVAHAEKQNTEKTTKPQHPEMKWVEYFVNEKGFQIHEAQTATTIPMFLHWDSVGVSIPDVELAMIAANRKMNGERPSFPTYYRNFVEQVMLEKQKSPNPATNRNSGFSKPKQQERPVYVYQGKNNAIDSTAEIVHETH